MVMTSEALKQGCTKRYGQIWLKFSGKDRLGPSWRGLDWWWSESASGSRIGSKDSLPLPDRANLHQIQCCHLANTVEKIDLSIYLSILWLLEGSTATQTNDCVYQNDCDCDHYHTFQGGTTGTWSNDCDCDHYHTLQGGSTAMWSMQAVSRPSVLSTCCTVQWSVATGSKWWLPRSRDIPTYLLTRRTNANIPLMTLTSTWSSSANVLLSTHRSADWHVHW